MGQSSHSELPTVAQQKSHLRFNESAGGMPSSTYIKTLSALLRRLYLRPSLPELASYSKLLLAWG